MFDNRIDLSLQHVEMYELKDHYGSAILNKQVTLYANNNGVIVDNYTYSGKLGEILKDNTYGYFFSERRVLLIEEVDNVIYIDYEWDENELESLVRSYIPYYAYNKIEYIFINCKETTIFKGCADYQKLLDCFSQLSLAELFNTLLNNIWCMKTNTRKTVGYIIDTRINSTRTDDIYNIKGVTYEKVEEW